MKGIGSKKIPGRMRPGINFNTQKQKKLLHHLRNKRDGSVAIHGRAFQLVAIDFR